MSQKALERLKAELGEGALEESAHFGDRELVVAPADWQKAAALLKEHPECSMDHFIDLTVVDYPEREPELPRFDVVLMVRSMSNGGRMRLRTRVGDDEPLASLVGVWAGADWAEREAYDMFGVRFAQHPDLRRILLYDEFEGYPLRKDYPIERAQPLVAYRDVEGIDKIPPFGPDMGQPWGRIEWSERLAGGDQQVSPAIGVQVGQRRALSQGSDDGAREGE